MTLITSISGIRGTIGGVPGEGLTPVDIVKFTAAFGALAKERNGDRVPRMVIGRDARISGRMLQQLVSGTLQGLGIGVVDLGLSTTPTVELAVTEEKAIGGMILTASHNPSEWNALKLLNEQGEFISASDGREVLDMAEQGAVVFAEADSLGGYETKDYLNFHIDKITDLELVNVDAIQKAGFKVAVDAVNSTGGVYVPALLNALGVKDIIELYCEPSGQFPHNPEPIPENLQEICKTVVDNKADAGIVVDPDVDRLALVCENGELFGEEYTLVSIADYVLQNKKGNTVSNLSSTQALRDVTEAAGGKHIASAVGEVNVVASMKENNAVIGGEGNGGVIYPELHYGRDALVGIALFLSHLAKSGMKCSELRESYPNYFISKNKIELTPDIDVDLVLKKIEEKYNNEDTNTTDGVRIDFKKEWVHLRKSNTEPIIRIYAESRSAKRADALAERIMSEIKEILA